MTKKLRSGKSKAQKQRHPSRQHRTIDRRPTPRAQEPSNQGIPEEHYYGERTPGVTANPADVTGSLDEETLSKHAPYNRTYGRQAPEVD